MHQYRIYTFREDGHFSTLQRIKCTGRNRPFEKRSNLWKAEMVNSGRVHTLSRDSPTFRKPQSRVAREHRGA